MKARWLLALGCLGAAPAGALQLELTRPELCELSTHVVFAEVTDVQPVWTATGGVERQVHVAVSDAVRGPKSDGLELVLPGGTIGELTVWVEDAPTLLENGRYLLFLGPDASGRLTVYGGHQGVVRVLPEGSLRGESLTRARQSVAVCRE